MGFLSTEPFSRLCCQGVQYKEALIFLGTFLYTFILLSKDYRYGSVPLIYTCLING